MNKRQKKKFKKKIYHKKWWYYKKIDSIYQQTKRIIRDNKVNFMPDLIKPFYDKYCLQQFNIPIVKTPPYVYLEHEVDFAKAMEHKTNLFFQIAKENNDKVAKDIDNLETVVECSIIKSRTNKNNTTSVPPVFNQVAGKII